MPKPRDRWPELCKKVSDDDGLPVREVGSWTEGKLFFWNRYIEITTTGMKNRWSGRLAYIDLFAGPGVCRIRDSKKRIPGSPLIAAHAPHDFLKIVAIEYDTKLAKACETRLQNSCRAGQCAVLIGDCNQRIGDAIRELPIDALTLAFVDPEGLHAHFSTIAELTRSRRTDLFILFADRMDIVRNVALYAEQERSNLDLVLGPETQWRDRWNNLPNQNSLNTCQLFEELYRDQLRNQLGYRYFRRKIVGPKKNPLYRMIFATKHERGLDFWDKVTRRDKGGQRELF